MIEITITIREVPENSPKYVIPRSNFTETDAYLLGIPCKVVSEKYRKRGKMYMEVLSCVTGIKYEIPCEMDWLDVFDNFADLFKEKRIQRLIDRGVSFVKDPENYPKLSRRLAGKFYFPMDNSYSAKPNGERLWVANEVVTLISEPFLGLTEHGNEVWFVFVKKLNGEAGKCMFMEWKLVP
jgi:hypothetical protein